MQIRTGHLDHPAVVALLGEHLHALAQLTPADHMHALGLERLRAADIRFWTAWIGGDVVGCVALRHLDATHAELKSMCTARRHLRQGIAATLLDHVLAHARAHGYRRVSLETGSSAEFVPAHRLYARAGFAWSGPFGDYVAGPHSVFMTLELAQA